MTFVRIVRADPGPDGSAVNGQQLIVLADTLPTEDGGYRAVPLWLPVIGAKLLLALDRPARDAVMAVSWRRRRPGCRTRPGWR